MGVVEQPRPLRFPPPLLGQVQDQPPGTTRDPGRNRDDRASDRRRGRPGQPGAGDDPGRAGEVERHDRHHEPGGVRSEDTGWQVRQGAGLEIRVDLFDDRDRKSVV